MSVCSLSKGKISTDQLAQTMAMQRPQATMTCSGNAAVKSGSAAPRKNGKATNSAPDQTKPKKKVYQQKQVFQKPKKSLWATKNKYAYQPKTYAP